MENGTLTTGPPNGVTPAAQHDQCLQRFNVGDGRKDHAFADELGVVATFYLDFARGTLTVSI